MALSRELIIWKNILREIDKGKCTPFIGAGACAFKNDQNKPWLPLGKDIVEKWLRDYPYPLKEYADYLHLDKVAQFVEIITDDYVYPKSDIGAMLAEIEPPDFSNDRHKDTPHSVLADLNLPVYITTNYDTFMETALEKRGRKPDSEFCRWDEALDEFAKDSLFDDPNYEPTVKKPLVYHLHGRIDVPQSMVLTESDYINFVVNLTKDENLLPNQIRNRLGTTSLLFIGYSLEDINFRVIFQSIMNRIKPIFMPFNLAVQLAPTFPANIRDEALQYLAKYTKNMFKVSVYWIDATEFAKELRINWEIFQNAKRQRA